MHTENITKKQMVVANIIWGNAISSSTPIRDRIKLIIPVTASVSAAVPAPQQ